MQVANVPPSPVQTVCICSIPTPRCISRSRPWILPFIGRCGSYNASLLLSHVALTVLQMNVPGELQLSVAGSSQVYA